MAQGGPQHARVSDGRDGDGAGAAVRLGAPTPRGRRTLELAGLRLELGARPLVMGILNVTPDSFSDGGLFEAPEAAVARGRRLAELGAAWIDVGGESTRPGAAPVDAATEARRVVPVVRALAAALPARLVCVDTSKAAVAEQALAAGARLVNDVTALRDPRMGEIVARSGAALCLMHMRGEPRTMQLAPSYDDVVAEVVDELGAARERALRAGVRVDRIFVDPGFGFGKSVAHNFVLLRNLGALRVLGAPVVIGTSRKSMLGAVTGRAVPAERVAASVASVAIAAVLGGADVVRAHDVAETCDALAVAQAVLQAEDGAGAGGWPRLGASEAERRGRATTHRESDENDEAQHVASATI